jgi:hypothetical protein
VAHRVGGKLTLHDVQTEPSSGGRAAQFDQCDDWHVHRGDREPSNRIRSAAVANASEALWKILHRASELVRSAGFEPATF